jgi:hypothetical protein
MEMHNTYKNESRCVLLSLPLIIRLFEYIREEPTTDEDLHFMAERISELGWDGIRLTMNQYSSIIPQEKPRTYSASYTNHIEATPK